MEEWRSELGVFRYHSIRMKLTTSNIMHEPTFSKETSIQAFELTAYPIHHQQAMARMEDGQAGALSAFAVSLDRAIRSCIQKIFETTDLEVSRPKAFKRIFLVEIVHFIEPSYTKANHVSGISFLLVK